MHSSLDSHSASAPKLLDHALWVIERRLAPGRKIVVTAKSTLAGRISALRSEPAWFHLTQFWTSFFTKTHFGLPWSTRRCRLCWE